jgi:hypothetical protein
MSPVPPLAPLVTAALLLFALPELDALGMPRPTASAVIEALGVSRAQAYDLKNRLEDLLPTIKRPVGRPPAPEPAIPVESGLISRKALDFVYQHPGAVTGEGRRRYSDDFRRFVLDLAAKNRDIPLPSFADALQIPVGTLRDWLEGGVSDTAPASNLADIPPREPTEPQIETVLDQWSRWNQKKGGFSAFCRHIQHDWRIPFGRTFVADILAAHGVRFAKRRSGRSPDEDALRGQFVTFFPNAQWVGDGSPVDVIVGSRTFTFNLECMVDPCSGAVTGASLRDNEDGAAVIAAFEDAVATTGSAPLGLLLDNKPSNHTDFVIEALGETRIVRATPERPQNKAHVEGTFGLFQQVAPALVLTAASSKELARQFLAAIVTTWGRTLNHRPRKDRCGKSRVQLHIGQVPSAEQIAAASAALDKRIRRQNLARQTRAARQDPLVRALLAAAFTRLGFVDPEGALLTGIARYPLDAVVDGIATFEGKLRAKTLPKGVDARYLLGIVKNLAEQNEGFEVSLALWERRREAKDAALDAAERERDRVDEAHDAPEPRLKAYVDRALCATRSLDRFFWLGAAVDVVADENVTAREALFRLAARRIAATFAAPHDIRLSATRFLASQILPIA